jgi:hypothetical protein
MRFSNPIFYIFILITIQSCDNENRNDKALVEKVIECPVQDDLFYKTTLAIDSTEKDFSELIKFIEAKGELSRFDRLKRLDSTVGSSIFLSKLLCPNDGESSAIESWRYDSVHSFTIELSSVNPIPEQRDLDFTIFLSQYNFANKDDMKIVMAKLLESGVGHGDIRKKWNEYSIVTGKNRLYVIKSAFARSQKMQEKYAKIIEEEWIK